MEKKSNTSNVLNPIIYSDIVRKRMIDDHLFF